MRRITPLLGLLTVAATAAGRAEVTASGPSGFSLKIEMPVAVGPRDAFINFVRIGSWWNKEHTYSGDPPTHLTLDPRPGGCFCERLPNGGFVEHMNVVFSAPGKILRLAGGLGPLQAMGANGVMALQFNADGPNTRLIMTYIVSGFATGKGLAEIAPAVDGVLTDQLTRFKRFAETGKPTG
jgi:hypothetical protein